MDKVSKENKSAFIALRFSNFRSYWIAVFAASIAMQMQTVGVNWHMYELTNSPVSLGLVGIAGFVPVLLFSLIGGLFADKHDRKTIMITSQIILAGAAFLVSGATFLGSVSPLVLFGSVATLSLVMAFDIPARQSVIPSLVPSEYLVNAVSLATLVRQIALITGPSIAGFLIEFFGVKAVYATSGVLFLFAVVMILPVAIHHSMTKKEVAFRFSSILEGIAFVRRSPLIYSTMMLDFFATFFASATVLLPIFAKDTLGVGAKGLGILYAAPAIGALLTGTLLAGLHTLSRLGKILLAGVLLYGVATVGFGFSHIFLLSLFFLMLIGAGDMVSTVIRNSIRQLVTPDHLRGRMVSINMIFFTGGPYLGGAEAGFLAALLGAPLSVVVGGVGTILSAILVGIFVPVLRRYDTHKHPDLSA